MIKTVFISIFIPDQVFLRQHTLSVSFSVFSPTMKHQGSRLRHFTVVQLKLLFLTYYSSSPNGPESIAHEVEF